MICACSLAGTAACASCANNPNSEKQYGVNFITWTDSAERTCKIESKIFIEGEYVPCPYYEYEMECGGHYRWDDPEPPKCCPNCGAKVRDA